MKQNLITGAISLLTAATARLCVVPVQAADKKPKIVVIMSDDVGIWNISA